MKNLHPSFWLIVPWVTVGGLALAYATGLADKILPTLPLGLGDIAQNNIGWGYLIVTFGSSAIWAYHREQNRGFDRPTLIGKVIGLSILLTIVQACSMAAVAFAGCLVIIPFVSAYH